MLIKAVDIEALKALPYRFLIKAVIEAVNGKPIIESLDIEMEAWIAEIEAIDRGKRFLL